MYIIALRLKKAFGLFIYGIAASVLFISAISFLKDNLEIAGVASDYIVYALESPQGKDVHPGVLGASEEKTAVKVKPGEIRASIRDYDYRAHVFDSYFRKYESPLEGYGQVFVDACEKYGAPKDCLLLVAIAKAETNLCKTGISHQQKNCWGFGGSGKNRIEYSNYEISIDEVTRRVMSGYGTRFFEDANNGELYYCGRHCEKWGEVVNSYKYEINSFAVGLGYPSLL